MSGRDVLGGLTCDEVREAAGSFVLGAPGATEDAAVRAHLADCSEPHPEIAELGGVLPALAESVPIVEPPAALKGRIMAAAAAELAARAEVVPAAAPTPFPSPQERHARRSRASAGSWILRIAAVLAIVALGGWNLLLQGQLSAAQVHQRDIAAVLDVAAKPGSLTAVLRSDGGSGSGLAAIDGSGAITIAMQDLVPTTGASVYEAWLIGSDGVPAPLGSFKVGSSGTAYFAAKDLPPPPGAVLALTLEPGPNAKTPTLPIISKGAATAAS
ncbi:MAG: anti-sigma factor [Chloroflexota bacterium]